MFWPAALLVALLTIPFHPLWMDMELVRRAWLLCLVGALCLLRPRNLLGLLSKTDVLFLLFLGWSGIGALSAANGWEAIYRLAHLTALFALFRWGRFQEPEIWLRAILPTAILVSAYGLLQSMGLEWPAHYANSQAPVSTLGNLNVASEFVAVAVAAAMVLLWSGERTLSETSLILCTAYLVVNGSRSGLIAVPAALLWLSVTGRGFRKTKVLALSLCLIGAGLGLAFPLLQPDPPEVLAPEAQVSTIDVRLEIWKACEEMVAEAPFGHGPGQFKVQYPRFRSQAEIELSTNERGFASTPRTAHNDPLELLVEGGWPGLLLGLAFGVAASVAVCGGGMTFTLTPLVCFALLSLVRSPLGNAPVAAWILVYLGSLLPGAEFRSRGVFLPWSTRLLGLALLAGGLPILISQTLATPYLAARANLQDPDPQHLERAVTWAPFETHLRELLVQEYLNPEPPSLPDAQRHLTALQELAPHSPFRLLWLAKEALLSQDLDRAQTALDELHVLDPGDIEASTLQSTILFLRGDHQAAIEAVYRNPHRRLQEHLVEHMQQLEDGARDAGDGAAAQLYECERVFLTALDRLREVGAAQSGVENVFTCFGESDQLQQDIRPWLLMAIQFHLLDQPADVENMAEEASQRGLELSPLHRDLFDGLVDPLRETPAWRDLLLQ